jgi:hypothetical protein
MMTKSSADFLFDFAADVKFENIAGMSELDNVLKFLGVWHGILFQ